MRKSLAGHPIQGEAVLFPQCFLGTRAEGTSAKTKAGYKLKNHPDCVPGRF